MGSHNVSLDLDQSSPEL